ncbi:MAG: sensor histidine kinase [Steroidobacteraceae bacterium]
MLMRLGKLSQLRSRRNLLFWSLHCAGWLVYALTVYFGFLFYKRPANIGPVIAIATVAGFVLSAPMRYVYRSIWGRSERWVILGVLVASYVTALPLRIVINIAYQHFCDPSIHFDSLFDLFRNALLSTYLLLCWSALYFGIKYYESKQQQQEAMLKAVTLAQEAQLKMLRYQLNPHFLFNTLNAISTLILDNQNRTANHAVMRLSEFLRYTLDQDPMKRVTLRQEIEALDLYLGTERLRFGDRLRLEYAIESAALDGLLPSLLLQPLVENALKYAVSPREQGGMVRIEGRARGAMLEISVIDDGPGLDDHSRPSPGAPPLAPAVLGAERRGGVGLRNTRERLAVLYGDSFRFAVLDSHPGLRVEMALPLETAAHEETAARAAEPRYRRPVHATQGAGA